MNKLFLIPLAALLLGYRPAHAQVERVGIGTTAPTQALDVVGNLRLRTMLPPDATQLLLAEPDGRLGMSRPLPALAGLGVYATLAPTPPVYVGDAGGSNVSFSRVAAAGRYVFVAGLTQLRTYDTQASPTVPVLAGSPQVLSGTVGALAASPSTLYAITATQIQEFTIGTNLTSPITPKSGPVAVAPPGTTSTTIHDAVVAGSFLYVAATFAGSSSGTSTVVRVFDLTTPKPTAVATLEPGLTGRVQLAANVGRGYLLVAPDAAPYQAYSLATAAVPLPALLTTAPAATMPAFEGGLAMAGGVLYGATNATTPPALAVYDEDSPTDPAQPAALGTVALPNAVRDMAVTGSYAYLLTADAARYQLLAVRVATPALIGLNAAGNLTSVAPVLPPADNLGNHRATQNLDLGVYSLTGNGGASGLRISRNGQVGLNKTPNNYYLLDVAGGVQATRGTTTGVLSVSTLSAGTNLRTPSLLAPRTGAHNPLPAATGQVTAAGGSRGGSGNYAVTRVGTGTYRLTFTGGPLATGNLQQAAFVASLGGAAGFITFTAPANAGYVEVYTRSLDPTWRNDGGESPNHPLTDRDFSFSVFLP